MGQYGAFSEGQMGQVRGRRTEVIQTDLHADMGKECAWCTLFLLPHAQAQPCLLRNVSPSSHLPQPLLHYLGCPAIIFIVFHCQVQEFPLPTIQP